jgi:hypothetical protein
MHTDAGLVPRSYDGAQGDVQFDCEYSQPIDDAWKAASNVQGSFSLTITSVGNETPNPDGGAGETFSGVHGSLTCTMPPDPAHSGTSQIVATAMF